MDENNMVQPKADQVPQPTPTPPSYVSYDQSAKIYQPKEQWLALLCILLGYAFVRLVLWKHPGVGVTIFAAAFWAVVLVFAKSNKKPLSGRSYALLGFSILFAIPPALFSDSTILTPCLYLWMILTGLWIAEVNDVRRGNIAKDCAKVLVATPFSSFFNGFPALGQLCKRLPAQKSLSKVLIGLCIALPITGIVTLLLVSADDLFSNAVEHMSRYLSTEFWDNFFEGLSDLLFTIPLFLYLFGILDGNYRNQDTETYDMPGRPSILYRTSPLTLCVAITPLLAIYTLFFVTQAPYYFSAFERYLPPEYTVASYARKGFFELCVVACINFAILLALQFLSKRKENGTKTLSVRIYSSILSLFTLLLIATAFRKMLLYIGDFGLTKLRVITSWFMLLLGVCFLLILVYQWWDKFPIVKSIATVCITFAAVLCFANVDGCIARYNIAAYQSGKLERIDVHHLGKLSMDATPHIITLLDDDDEKVVKDVKYLLKYRKEQLEEWEFPEYSLSAGLVKAQLDVLDLETKK